MRCFLIIATLLLVSTTYAQDDTGVDAEKSAGNENRDTAKALVEKATENGFVFVDGRYVEAPYRFRADDKRLFINDTPFDQSLFEGLASKRTLANGRTMQRASRLLRETLESDGVVILFAESPVAHIYGTDSYELLRVLVDDEARASFTITDLRGVRSVSIDQEAWRTFVRDFECPQELRERADGILTRVQAIEESNAAQTSARRTMESSVYPLTIVGMLLVVLAFGHLLSFKPDSEGESPETGIAKRAVTRSLALVAALSALDLIWTLIVSRAGDMKELNPLGAALMDDPFALIALKTIATLTAVVLLFTLRQHRVAQQGAWWACLICTLLTVRWLTFNSMFA
jgi:hypothetical protein